MDVKMHCTCLQCGNQFTLSGADIRKAEYKDSSGKSIWCTYFWCEKCKTKHFVQLDDQTTNGMLVELIKLLARITRLQRQNKSVKKYRKRYDDITKKLEAARKKLAETYADNTLFNAYGIEEVIRMYNVEFPEVSYGQEGRPSIQCNM